jgi:serine/threonine-protein kinase
MNTKPRTLSVFIVLIVSLLVACGPAPATPTPQAEPTTASAAVPTDTPRPAGPRVITLAGGEQGYAEGSGAAAKFSTPLDVAVDAKGNVYVADSGNSRVRLITPDGIVSTYAGSGKVGYADGPAAAALFSAPTGIAVDKSGNLYIADSVTADPHPLRVRMVTPAGAVSTLAGGSEAGYTDGPGTKAFFRTPANLAADAAGNVYVADTNNHRIRLIHPDGMVGTLAGQLKPGMVSGYADGPVAESKFNSPRSVAVDGAGTVYVADTGNQRIRAISPAGQVTTLAGGSSEPGYKDGKGAEARFSYPSDLAVDAAGTLYVADTANHCIRKVTPDGTVTTLAGAGTAGYADGPLGEAQFRAPEGIAVDSAGNIYVADTGNQRIREIVQP